MSKLWKGMIVAIVGVTGVGAGLAIQDQPNDTVAYASSACVEADEEYFDETYYTEDPACFDYLAGYDWFEDGPCGGYGYMVKITVIGCEESLSGEIWAYSVSANDDVYVGDFTDGVFWTGYGEWSDLQYWTAIADQDGEIDYMRVQAFCCESCCAAQDASCGSGSSPSGSWYWNGCACQQWSGCLTGCVGEDCDEFFPSQSACELAYYACLYGC